MSTPAIQWREPTGLPSWPILLLAGVEKAGKTYQAAVASASERVGMTWWVAFGEDEPDEYGAIPGARFRIVQHDGTYRGLIRALDAINAQPRTDPDRPDLIVVDSATRVWELLSAEAQAQANERAVKKAKRFNKPVPEDDVTIGMDLWNTAAERWAHVMECLREHDGPVILTARLDVVTVVDERGEPTKEKTLRVKAHKSLPFDVGAIAHLMAPGEVYLTGVRSLRMPLQVGERKPVEDFTVDRLWGVLGIDEGTSPRTQTTLDPSAAVTGVPRKVIEDLGQRISDATSEDELKSLWAEVNRAGAKDARVDPAWPTLGELISHAVEEIRKASQPAPEQVEA